MSLTVAKDRVVHIHYVLTDENEEFLDASGGQPLGYLHGHDNLVPGLETALEGKAAGDEVEATVPPEEGYGAYKPDAFQSVHRRELPKDTKIDVGSPVRVEGSAGPVLLWITKVQGARVTITSNHPLAGKTLRFKVRIAAVREGTPEEIAHGHAHEPGGHAH